MNKQIHEQELKCPICYHIVEEPNETSCCGHLFCKGCVKMIKHKSCPICRSTSYIFRENLFIKELFKKTKITCPYECNAIISISELRTHRYECENAKYKCAIEGCTFEGKKEDSVNHCFEKHADYFIMMLEDFSLMKSTFEKHSLYNKLQAKQDNEINYENLFLYK
jgi:hypothetical protein